MRKLSSCKLWFELITRIRYIYLALMYIDMRMIRGSLAWQTCRYQQSEPTDNHPHAVMQMVTVVCEGVNCVVSNDKSWITKLVKSCSHIGIVGRGVNSDVRLYASVTRDYPHPPTADLGSFQVISQYGVAPPWLASSILNQLMFSSFRPFGNPFVF
jgi:hypothetical protein